MIVEPTGVGQASVRSLKPGPDPVLDQLLARLSGEGQDLEVLILEDSRLQRRAALAMRQVNSEARRRQVKAAARAMERAALFRLGSAVAGCAVNCVAAAATGSDFTKLCCRSLAEAFNKINPLDLLATGQDVRSKRMDLAGGESAEGVRTGDDWFVSARELECRLFDRLEQIQRGDHELNAELLGHLGGG